LRPANSRSELVRRAELERAGISDPYRDHRKRPLAAHLDDFEAAMRAEGNADKQVDQVLYRVRLVIQGCGFAFLADPSGSRASTFLVGLRKDNGKREREAAVSVQTRNRYLTAIKQFCNWRVKGRRMAESPVAHPGRGNAKLDRRRDRSILSSEEFAALLRAAAAGEPFPGPAGFDRVLLDPTSASTGLRVSNRPA
jgi:integrase